MEFGLEVSWSCLNGLNLELSQDRILEFISVDVIVQNTMSSHSSSMVSIGNFALTTTGTSFVSLVIL
jgi:hypothetical protein